MRKQNVKMEGKEGEIIQKDLIFLARYSTQGPEKIVIFVPKEYHERIRRVNNPIKVTVEAALK
jgi:hypothetical protein